MAACCDRQRHGLCCLFPEALENIFRYLALPEIQLVCGLCRRLNRLAVDTLLASNGILDPTVKCHIRLDRTSDPAADSLSALVALQFALSIPRMNHFAITFTRTSDTTRMVQSMRRCRRVLLKFPSIRDVTVEFQEIEYDSRFLASGGLKYPLKSDFQALLDTIQVLPSLESLRVATGSDFDSNYMLELFPSVVGIHSISPPVGSTLVKKARKIYKGLRPRPRPSPSLPRHTPITFLIDTPILVLPSFYPWTMSILSCRSITSLRLHMLIAAVDWPIILREIAEAVPHLTELTILGVRMAVPALVRTVSQFRDLSSLTMDSAPDFFTEPSFRTIATAPAESAVAVSDKRSLILIPKAYLANLTSLAVRPEHLEVLLKPYAPLPALASLCVRLEILDLNSPGMPPLMRKIILRLRDTHKSIAPLLDVRANVSSEALMCRTLDIALSKGIEWEEAFDSIENLRVRDYCVYNCVILARWLTVFRGATKISLTGISGSPVSVERTVSEIHRTCPQVRSVTVEGMSRGLPETDQELDRRTSGFLELPDDVLLIIFGQLGPVELYALSRQSRRLNLLALPLYFAQKGVSDPSQLCEFRLVNSPTAADVLSALNSALFLREIKHISCQFKSGGYVFCYMHHIQRLMDFLVKFPSVEKVSLELAELANVDSVVNEVGRAKWRDTFGKLLNVILEKSCKELVIQGAPYLKPGASEPEWPKDEATMELSSLARTSSSALSSFSFNCTTTCLSHSGMLWTFSVLRYSRITRLSTTVVSSSLLKIIAQELPTLPELDITYCSSGLELQLIDLLCKLQCLTRLTLPLRDTIDEDLMKCEVPAFLCLRTLTAPPPFIAHFLTAKPPLPALEHITVVSFLIPRQWSIPNITVALTKCGSPAPPSIAFDIALSRRDGQQSKTWVGAGDFQRFVGEEKSLTKSVRALTVRGSLAAAGGRHRFDQLVEEVVALVPYFPALHGLSVNDETGKRMSDLQAAPRLARILAVYPGVKSVSFNDTQIYTVG